jgi:hypothetical protein
MFKGKGDIQECRNFKEIKLMSNSMKIWENLTEKRIKSELPILENQFGFMSGKSKTDPLFYV